MTGKVDQLTGADAETFAAFVLSVLRQARGDELVFGRRLEMDDAQIGSLIRWYADQRGLS